MKVQLRNIVTEIPEGLTRIYDPIEELQVGDLVLKVWDNDRRCIPEINYRMLTTIKHINKEDRYITFGDHHQNAQSDFNATTCSGGVDFFSKPRGKYPHVYFLVDRVKDSAKVNVWEKVDPLKALIYLAFIVMFSMTSCEKDEPIELKSETIEYNNDSTVGSTKEEIEFVYTASYESAFLFETNEYSTGYSVVTITEESIKIIMDVRNPDVYADYEADITVTLYDEETGTVRGIINGDDIDGGEFTYIEGMTFTLQAENPKREAAKFMLF